jgi:IPT/TIG domain
MSRRIFSVCMLAVAALATLVGAPGASAAKSKGPVPVITKVTPMRISVGGTLTIKGRHFRSKAKSNTVVFHSSNGRSAFVKPRRASSSKLVLKVTAPVARLLTVRNSSQRPTRLKLRVLAGKFSKFTSRRLSPVVLGLSADGGGGGGGGTSTVCADDSDHDNDLLSNSLEKSLGTDPCLADTDNDDMIDGWEYYAAKDLNIKAVPYPGKRPFPNALDPSDGKAGDASAWDFDGDGLKTYEEYRAWRRTGSSFNAAAVGGTDAASPLGYSDGTKTSRPSEVPGVPAWRSAAFGLSNPTEPFPSTYKRYSGGWHDDERDADADGLNNWLEAARGPGHVSWWAALFASPGSTAAAWPDPANASAPCSVPGNVQEFGAFSERPFTELDLTDGDVDGDSRLDGEDDQDFDDVSNIQELYETLKDLDADGGLTCGTESYPSRGGQGVNAFNPCAPNQASRTCDDYKPF